MSPTYLNAHMGCGSTNEPEWRADVDFEDDVPGIIRRSVEHAVVREACIVDDVVQLAVLSV